MTSEEFEARKQRGLSQLELIKMYLENRYKAIINIPLGGTAIIALAAGFIRPSIFLQLGIILLICFIVSVFWYDAIVNKRAQKKSELILGKILGQSSADELEEIKSQASWVEQNMTEIVATIFSIIAIAFLALLIFSFKNDDTTQIDRQPKKSEYCSWGKNQKIDNYFDYQAY